MKRLVLFVEGVGDVAALPCLIGQLLAQLPDELQGQLFVDNAPMRIGGVHQITANRQADLPRHLGNASKRPQLGAVLLVVDGDADVVEEQHFCAAAIARTLARRATSAGAGTLFSFATVFVRQEYESFLIAAADQLPGLKSGVTLPNSPEESPRDAKGWLRQNLVDGYNPVDRQLELTRLVKDWTPVRSLRSFRRLEHALSELASAIATGQHVISPRQLAD